MKNIVLTGFGHITLLDLDTIDLSNLNRQFLFRKKDVKKSKALVCSVSLSVGLLGAETWVGRCKDSTRFQSQRQDNADTWQHQGVTV